MNHCNYKHLGMDFPCFILDLTLLLGVQNLDKTQEILTLAWMHKENLVEQQDVHTCIVEVLHTECIKVEWHQVYFHIPWVK